ncbi:UPF0738 family protein [Neobacillus dielmonensis]|uniref:UPF0738 family protein n=1 Tax=Neobacillus dielmonensis TaxID=1347369 RepID=UPI0005A75269|nr:hypothetical protein [Neobacillus dielmonensis]
MKKSILIINADNRHNKVLLQAAEPIKGFVPSGQILVDSEHFSFIYLMEDQADYTYIVLTEAIWPLLKLAMEQNLPVYIEHGEVQVELECFRDEMDYLITNIKGNSNYGNEMVSKVEAVFLA